MGGVGYPKHAPARMLRAAWLLLLQFATLDYGLCICTFIDLQADTPFVVGYDILACNVLIMLSQKSTVSK